MNNANTGLVLKIHRMARHDGPGIRTLVCMKGCPLSCQWCSTPESQDRRPQVMIAEYNCNRCGKCVEACPRGARTLDTIDWNACDNCGMCVDACIYGGLTVQGTRMDVDQLFREIEKDSAAYRHSGGGVTFGGGEATMQADFVAKVLARCRRVFYHTALETCGLTPWKNLEKILPHVTLLYYDIKHIDDAVHRKITGASNRVIQRNAVKAAEMCPMIVRVPVVPGLNDSQENLEATARFASKLGKNLMRIELLPYHELGVASYARVGRVYPLKGAQPQTSEQMEQFKRIVEKCGVPAQIGG